MTSFIIVAASVHDCSARHFTGALIVVVKPHDIPKELEAMRGRIEDLFAELRAIRVWDRHYSLQKIHDEIDRAAWQARGKRLAEIQKELDELRTASPASVPSRLTCKSSAGDEGSESEAGNPA